MGGFGLLLLSLVIVFGFIFLKDRKESKIDGMKHLYSFNTYGYYFDIYSNVSKEKERNGTIEVKENDDLYFMIENAGQKRKFAIQIFIDYVQVPIKINGKEYYTFYVEADENFSKEYKFNFIEKIDYSIDHKMMAIMTASSDLHAKDIEGKYPTNEYSIAYDIVLSSNKENKLSIDETQYDKVYNEYKDSWYGLIINDDIKNLTRKIPSKEIKVKAGEKFDLQYQVGGYTDCEESIIVVSLGMEQILINNQYFVKCQTKNKNIVSGIITITAPKEEGLYELTGWVIKNPFLEGNNDYTPLDATYRVTINVCR